MSQQRRTRIPEEEWERHKATIQELFLEKNGTLTSEDGLISTMEKKHGFSAR